jgi:hypothetical protein
VYYSIKQLKKNLRFCKTNGKGRLILKEKNGGIYKIFEKDEWLQWFKKCLHRKINRNLLSRGKKDNSDYFYAMRRAQNLLNSRAIINHPSELNYDRGLLRRFNHRLELAHYIQNI